MNRTANIKLPNHINESGATINVAFNEEDSLDMLETKEEQIEKRRAELDDLYTRYKLADQHIQQIEYYKSIGEGHEQRLKNNFPNAIVYSTSNESYQPSIELNGTIENLKILKVVGIVASVVAAVALLITWMGSRSSVKSVSSGQAEKVYEQLEKTLEDPDAVKKVVDNAKKKAPKEKKEDSASSKNNTSASSNSNASTSSTKTPPPQPVAVAKSQQIEISEDAHIESQRIRPEDLPEILSDTKASSVLHKLLGKKLNVHILNETLGTGTNQAFRFDNLVANCADDRRKVWFKPVILDRDLIKHIERDTKFIESSTDSLSSFVNDSVKLVNQLSTWITTLKDGGGKTASGETISPEANFGNVKMDVIIKMNEDLGIPLNQPPKTGDGAMQLITINKGELDKYLSKYKYDQKIKSIERKQVEHLAEYNVLLNALNSQKSSIDKFQNKIKNHSGELKGASKKLEGLRKKYQQTRKAEEDKVKEIQAIIDMISNNTAALASYISWIDDFNSKLLTTISTMVVGIHEFNKLYAESLQDDERRKQK